MRGRTFKYVSATRKVGASTKRKSKAKNENKVISTGTISNIEDKPTTTVIKKQKKVKAPAAKKEGKGTIQRSKKVETMWFTIAIQDGRGKVVQSGSQLECLQYIASFVKNNDNHTKMYLTNGFKILG